MKTKLKLMKIEGSVVKLFDCNNIVETIDISGVHMPVTKPLNEFRHKTKFMDGSDGPIVRCAYIYNSINECGVKTYGIFEIEDFDIIKSKFQIDEITTENIYQITDIICNLDVNFDETVTTGYLLKS